MAQATALKTYDVVGQREDLTDLIATITLHETPLFSGLEKIKANGRYHEWQIDTLSTGNDNAQIEGQDFVFSIPGVRTRIGNYTQIFTKTVEVSDTTREVSVAGVEDEYTNQMSKRMKEIATDVEKALITGTGVSGASGAARRLKGFLNFIVTNVETGTGTAAGYVTETRYNNLLQTMWSNGARPTDAYVNGFQKRQISSFSTPNQRQIQMEGSKKLVNTIAVYESDFGIQTINLDPFMDADKVLALQKDLNKVAMLRDIKSVNVATVGDATRGALVGELTLQVGNEAANGVSKNLLTA